jgi:glycosyltransferase involved in cell wall biosynthesis
MSNYSVLHIAETLRGGIASYFDEILSSQVQTLGHDKVHILVPSSQVNEIRYVPGLGVHVFECSHYRFGNIWKLILAIRLYLRSNTINIVHAHSSFAGIAARVALRGLRRCPRLVYCAHGWAFDRESSNGVKSLFGRIELILSHWADAIICISNHDLHSALTVGISKSRLIVLPNAISASFHLSGNVNWPNVQHRFLFVGRFDRQKGVDIFIEAMRELGGDTFAYLVGSSVVNEECIKTLPANLAVTGWLARDVVQQYIASAHVIVIPSRWEGFGLTALEAMRASKPVIASNVGGLVELVIEGKTGFLVEPNSVADLVSKMRKCIDGSVDLAQFGLEAHEHFLQHYTADRLNLELFAVYSDVLNK